MNSEAISVATRLWARQCELSDRLDLLPVLPENDEDAGAERLRAITERELDEIDAALAQIAAGTYGLCELCGERIDDSRLSLQPHTTLCESCAPFVNEEQRT